MFVSKREEEVESRTKLVDGLKTALRTQPLRYNYCNNDNNNNNNSNKLVITSHVQY